MSEYAQTRKSTKESKMQSFQNMAKRIAEFDPTLSVGQVVDLTAFVLNAIEDAQRDECPDLTTHEGRVAFAKTLADVTDALAMCQYITAIKALRTAADDFGPTMGLKDAKEAIDELRMYGWKE
jgi:hypothetical protein